MHGCIVDRILAKEPAERFASGAQFALALREYNEPTAG